MAKQKTVHKKSVGRPRGRKFTETIPVRLELEAAERVEDWAAKNGLTRSDAVRRLVELGLRAKNRSQ